MADAPRIAIILPRHPELRAWWQRAVERTSLSATVVHSRADCERHLRDERTRAYVVFGDHAWRDLLGREEQVHAALRSKAVYRFGCSAETEARALLQQGLSAFIGYDGNLSFVLGTESRESTFFQPILAGVRALQNLANIESVTHAIRESWRQILTDLARKPGTDSREPFIRLFAQEGKRGLFQFGDSSWRFSSRPVLVVLDAFTSERSANTDDDDAREEVAAALKDEFNPRDLTPRVEVIDISPIVLQRLKADPQRMHNLSPREFEDLVANWLRAMNLQVQQVGGTYSRDGGIDFFALQDSWPIRVVLAVQVKHSRVNRNVSSKVVRELTGAVDKPKISAGVIVTNTRFTPDAQWEARNAQKIIQLYDFEDLRRWLRNEVVDDDVYDDLPPFIELADGLRVPVPRPIRSNSTLPTPGHGHQ